MTQPLERKVYAVVSLLTEQPAGTPPNPQLVQSFEYNLMGLIHDIPRYLMSIGLPIEETPAEIWIDLQVDGQSGMTHQIVKRTLDPKTIHHPKVWPLAALETIARHYMEGEEVRPGELFDQSADEMQMSYYECITLARQALGWKEN